ncbi:MAG TPA: basic secretory protein-like protein [Acidimicrobiales bacterium]|nr:basic secretory protein-like protein [Acidimicrobiales bacterium]
MAIAALALCLPGPGASSNAAAAGTAKTSANPNADCATADSVGSSVYVSQIGAIEKEITSTGRLGGSYPDPVYVEANTRNVLFPGDTEAAPLYTSGCFRGAIPTTGPVDSCTVHVQPIALSGKDALSTSDIHEALIHEMVHCYMLQRFGAAAYGFPDWFVEGAADWVANEIAGSHIVDGHWEAYLETPDKPLWNRDYDGFGFFVHLAESGTDPWQKIIPMAAALVASGNSNTSAWNAAAPTTAFLDNWGAGFAQGRYPGTPWDSTGPGLPRYPAKVPTQKPVKDLAPITVPSAAAATVIQPLDVDSQVVHVTAAASSYGRISLGGGKDDTLAQAQGVNYCTDSTGCQCPATSAENGARFRHMADGLEYVTVTGGTGTGTVTVEGETLQSFCSPVCVVGTWKVTNETVSLINASGGSGAILTITKNGVATIQHDGSAPLIIPGGSIQYFGQEMETVTLPTDPAATSGTWKWTIGAGNVSATTTEYGYTHSAPAADAPGQVASGTWTCSGDAMTNTIGFGNVSQSYTLTRVSH